MHAKMRKENMGEEQFNPVGSGAMLAQPLISDARIQARCGDLIILRRGWREHHHLKRDVGVAASETAQTRSAEI